MLKKIAPLIVALCTTTAHGSFGPQQFRMGVTAGQVFLLGDVLDSAGNAVGLGFNFAYQIDSEWAIEAQYLGSSHDNLKHSETSIGANYYFTDDPIFLSYANFGVNFVGHEMNVAGLPATFNENGFGLFGGVGMDFLVSDNVAAGAQLRYNMMFDVTARDGFNDRDVSVIQDFATLLVRLSYIFN